MMYGSFDVCVFISIIGKFLYRDGMINILNVCISLWMCFLVFKNRIFESRFCCCVFFFIFLCSGLFFVRMSWKWIFCFLRCVVSFSRNVWFFILWNWVIWLMMRWLVVMLCVVFFLLVFCLFGVNKLRLILFGRRWICFCFMLDCLNKNLFVFFL